MPPISILVGTVQLFFRKMGHPRTLSHLFLSFQTNITIFATKNVYPVYSNPRPSENESPPITTRPNTYFIFDISWTSLNEMLFLLWSNFFSLIWMHLPWTDRKLASARERERERANTNNLNLFGIWKSRAKAQRWRPKNSEWKTKAWSYKNCLNLH